MLVLGDTFNERRVIFLGWVINSASWISCGVLGTIIPSISMKFSCQSEEPGHFLLLVPPLLHSGAAGSGRALKMIGNGTVRLLSG